MSPELHFFRFLYVISAFLWSNQIHVLVSLCPKSTLSPLQIMKALPGIAQTSADRPSVTCCIACQSVIYVTGYLFIFAWDKAVMCSAYWTTINVASAYDIKGNNACGIYIPLCIKSQDVQSSQLTEGSESGLWSDLAPSLVNAKREISVDVWRCSFSPKELASVCSFLKRNEAFYFWVMLLGSLLRQCHFEIREDISKVHGPGWMPD